MNNEQRIKELEDRVAILEKIASNVRSDPGDSDLVSYSNGWTILYSMSGGYKIAKDNCKWIPFSNFNDLINYIVNNS